MVLRAPRWTVVTSRCFPLPQYSSRSPALATLLRPYYRGDCQDLYARAVSESTNDRDSRPSSFYETVNIPSFCGHHCAGLCRLGVVCPANACFIVPAATGQTTNYRFSDTATTSKGSKNTEAAITLTAKAVDDVQATFAIDGRGTRNLESVGR